MPVVVQGCLAGCALAIAREGLTMDRPGVIDPPMFDRVCAALDAAKIRVLGLYVIRLKDAVREPVRACVQERGVVVSVVLGDREISQQMDVAGRVGVTRTSTTEPVSSRHGPPDPRVGLAAFEGDRVQGEHRRGGYGQRWVQQARGGGASPRPAGGARQAAR